MPSPSTPSPASTDAPGPAAPLGTTVLGYPRIGPRRELKHALESYWRGRIDSESFEAAARGVRAAAWARLRQLGLHTVPVNDFSRYDPMLDTALLVGAVPRRFATIDDELERYFALARGTTSAAPLEMTKWFDTNYHYLVPEIGPSTRFAAHPDKPVDELAEAATLGFTGRPVLIGPITFLRLSKPDLDAPTGFDPLDRLDELVEVYRQVVASLLGAGAQWVQLDEPALVTDLTAAELDAVARTYDTLGGAAERPALLVTMPYGRPGEALPVLAATPIEAVALDLVSGLRVADVAAVPDLRSTVVVAGVVDGRNVWRTDLDAALDTLRALEAHAVRVEVGTSCSLAHVPHSVDAEHGLPDGLGAALAFAEEKVAELTLLDRLFRAGPAEPGTADAEHLRSARRSRSERLAAPHARRPDLRARLAALTPTDRTRGPAVERARAQQDRLGLPELPTTTIGSFPQTVGLRRARADLAAGRIDFAGYERRMRDEIAHVVALQEKIGLDVVVHGEPERNDMVQYFAEQLSGFAVTTAGWVQSYGSRCVRPPILYGEVERRSDLTVAWTTYAQSLTDRPVKGMLTGPVTMLAWSFVRDDEPIVEVARQVALAIRDEVSALTAAGTPIVQVDEPALRELLPLRAVDRPAYLDWAVEVFRIATSGVTDDTAIHTHLCYSEFGDVVDAIDALDADVTSIEAARSRMELLPDLARSGFARGVGPGVYDIHSPTVPSEADISSLIRRALTVVSRDHLWVNPDCGLKTRTPDEVVPALTHLVAAAKAVRAQLAEDPA